MSNCKILLLSALIYTVKLSTCAGEEDLLSLTVSKVLVNHVPVVGLEEKQRAIDQVISGLKRNTSKLRQIDETYEGVEAMFFPAEAPKISKKQGVTKELTEIYKSTIAKVASFKQPGFWELSCLRVRFCLQPAKKIWRCSRTPIQSCLYYKTDTRQTTIGPDGDPIEWIATPEHFVEFFTRHGSGQLSEFPSIPFLDKTSGRVVYRQTAQSATLNLKVPRLDLYLYIQPHLSYVDYLESISREIKDQGDRQIQVSRRTHPDEGVVISFNYEQGGSVHISVSLPGCQVQSAIDFDDEGKLQEMIVNEFESQDQMIASKMSYYLRNATINGNPVFFREYQRVKNPAVEPFTNDMLSIDSLDVKYGERLVDEIENQLYIYDNENGFVPVEEFKFAEEKLNAVVVKRSGNHKVLIVSGLLAILVLTCVVFRLRTKA